jgi:hypothetical protein
VSSSGSSSHWPDESEDVIGVAIAVEPDGYVAALSEANMAADCMLGDL